MGGSGSGGPFRSRTPQVLAKLVRKAQDASSAAGFEVELSAALTELLGAFNDRNVELVQERLDDVKRVLEGSIEGTIDQIFGGSVAKHTYVDGLSDVDSLLIINDSGLKLANSRDVIARISNILQKRVGEKATVSHGQMAVTLEYQDGMTLQLLPAIQSRGGKLRVPSSSGEGWSQIDPKAFQEALTRRNIECASKLVPTIKFAKAINGTLPESQRLSGYHVESLAIAAFRNYKGPKTTAAMLPVFFEKAKDLVLSPIRDSTGQSVHVDEYLGDKNSQNRLNTSHILGRIWKRMRNSSAAESIAQWRGLFGLDDE
jgi:hypothetical protein